MEIITFSLFLPPATLQLWNRMLSILLLNLATLQLWINHIDQQEGYSQNSESLNSENRKVAGCITKKELSPGIFSGNFQSKCSFKMFREEHYHMALSNKTPPPRFSRKREMFRFFFSGQEIYIFLVSQIIIVVVELCKGNRPNLLG